MTEELNPRYALLTVAQAGTYLGLDPSGVRRIIREGKLKARTFGQRSYMILMKDLIDYQERPQGRMGRPRKGIDAGRD